MSDKPALFTIDTNGISTLAREEMLNERPLARHLFSVAKYLGLGALAHAWFLGPDFDPHSLWSWGYLGAWPVPLALWFVAQVAVFGLYAVLLIVGCALLWLCICLAHDAHEKRKERLRAAARWKPSFVDPRD